jgi:Flp pilus assembly pilin Flp
MPRHAILFELIRRFRRDDDAQDLIEYTLLMAFVALASASLFIGAGSSVSKIWSSSNSTLSTAVLKAAS